MALVLKDRINETTTTTGTGTLTLAGATAGFQAFSVIGNSNTTYYCLVDGNNWEVGIGTYSSSGNTLARTTVLSNSSGNTSPITLGAGTKNVFGVFPADGVVVVNGTTIQVPGNAVLPIANGGTGSNTATFSGANITSINANNISSGVLAVAQGGTGSATATFSGENITSLNASNISTGTLANARTTATSSNGADTIVSRDASGNFSANVITADGSALTALNATSITSGTISNNRTTASSSNGASTIVQRDASGDFSANIITANSYSGSGASLTSLNASSISSGTVGTARLASGTANNTTYLRGDQTWATVSTGGGGKVLQVVQYVYTAKQTIASASFTATNLAATITPSSTSSKVLVLVTAAIGASGGNEGASLQLWMNGSLVGPVGDAAGSRIQAWFRAGEWTGGNSQGAMGMNYLHSPASTSALTYTLYMRGYSASFLVALNSGDSDTDTAQTTRSTSSITLMEIGA